VLADLAFATTGPAGEAFPDWVAAMNAADTRGLGAAFLARLPAGDPPRPRTTLKGVENDELVGLIQLIRPDAVILHCRRDLRDVMFSCWSLLFAQGNAWSYDGADLAAYIADHERLMAHWRQVLPPGRIVEVGYEALVADFEGEARRLLEACDLAWDPAVLAFHRSQRPVRTGSQAQVREPIFRHGVGRWRPFARRLAPMFALAGLDPELD
ncbi:MAG TPA: sulfotransferase, partial [Caulobacteraceae bacterium]|nr:sulfotransferase [Caulobacteraceae bacterium]